MYPRFFDVIGNTKLFKCEIDKCLKPGGWFCVGVKERLPSPFSDRFECIDCKEKIYLKFNALND